MQEKLVKLWHNCETKQLASVFENYMKQIGTNKYDSRRKDNSNTFLIDGKNTNWNRVECFYYVGLNNYGEENLLIVLRKKAGNYFIIGRKGERAFEVDHSGIRNYDETLLNAIMDEHKALFDELFKLT